jgi:hypothetical protein
MIRSTDRAMAMAMARPLVIGITRAMARTMVIVMARALAGATARAFDSA